MKILDEKELCLACVFNNGDGTCSNNHCKYQQIYMQGLNDGIDFVISSVSVDCDCDFINDCHKYNSCNETFKAKAREWRNNLH